MIKWVLYIFVFIFNVVGIELFRRWSLQKEFLDIPNERSSHKDPTPRGGGIIFVITSLFFYTIYQIFYSEIFLWSYLIGAILIALISWLDDLKNLSIVWRLGCHIFASGLVVFQLGHFERIYIPFWGDLSFGIFGIFLTLLWIIWLTNAYNFMDGIDGIAGIQAVMTSIGWVSIGYILGVDFYRYFGFILLFSSLGFLIHNWQPARVFMGDVGSAFLGYTFSILPLFANIYLGKHELSSVFFLISVLFVWLFFYDSLLTLILRLFRGEKFWKPHRKHLYQSLVINKFSHQFVSTLYGVLSLILVISTVYFVLITQQDIFIILIVTMITFSLSIFVYKNKLFT